MNTLRSEYFLVSCDGERLERFVFASPLDHVTLSERLATNAEHASLRQHSNRLATTVKFNPLHGMFEIIDPFTGRTFGIPITERLVAKIIGAKINDN